MKIDKSAIINAALDLLNEVGIDALSTRLLAQRLGVKQPALYWHFKSKKALLAAMNAVMLRLNNTHSAPSPDPSWQAFMRDTAVSFRRTLLGFRDGARVHTGAQGERSDLGQLDRIVTFMAGHGFTANDVMNLNAAISRYVVGCVMDEQNEASSAEATAASDASASVAPAVSAALGAYRLRSAEQHFLAGLDLLIDGFEARYQR